MSIYVTPIPATDIACRAILSGHNAMVRSVTWNPVESGSPGRLSSGGKDGHVHIWSSAGQFEHRHRRQPGRLTSLAWSPDGAAIASTGDDRAVIIWRVADGRVLATFRDHTWYGSSVAWSDDGAILASGSLDESIRFWRVADGSLIERFGRHTDWVRCLAWRRGNDLLAAGCKNGWIWLWDTAAMRLRCTLQDHAQSVLDVAWSPDGRTLASASEDGTVRLWSFLDPAPADSFNLERGNDE